ncbi:hypothetical protein CRYUN_Cryun31cG0051300 [Craigia yunnanensis]
MAEELALDLEELGKGSKIPTPISTSVKIYASLEGVDQEKLQTEFKPMSFDIKFHDVLGKNYQCAVPKLYQRSAKVVVKPTRVFFTLFKTSKGNWSDLHFKEDKLKPNLDKERDPMAGIMDLKESLLPAL